MEAKVPKLVMSSSPSTRFDGSDIDGLRGHTWPHMATMSHDTRHDATEGAVHAHRIYCDCDRFNSLWELVGTSWLEKTVAMTRLTEPDLPKLPQMLSSEVVESVEFLASNMVEPG